MVNRLKGYTMGVVRRIGSIAARKIPMARRIGKHVVKRFSNLQQASSTYWNNHNVTYFYDFKSREDSLEFLDWRTGQYLFYEELMPTSGFDEKVVMEYGCGPGHDLVSFLENSKPSKLLALDVAENSLALSKKRVGFHPNPQVVDYIHLENFNQKLAIADDSVDYIHTSGVLHHIESIDELMKEFHRILKPGGKMRIMVYNYESIFVHLYIAYIQQIVQNTNANMSLAEAFKCSTDGKNCPISRYYTPDEFIQVGNNAGFSSTYLGAAISADEMKLLPQVYTAIMSQALAKEHRNFLRALSFDEYNRPIYNEHVAGIDGIFELSKDV
jgi:ubiquinone/menaquinone biosynthesis C-methylase UbiE